MEKGTLPPTPKKWKYQPEPIRGRNASHTKGTASFPNPCPGLRSLRGGSQPSSSKVPGKLVPHIPWLSVPGISCLSPSHALSTPRDQRYASPGTPKSRSPWGSPPTPGSQSRAQRPGTPAPGCRGRAPPPAPRSRWSPPAQGRFSPRRRTRAGAGSPPPARAGLASTEGGLLPRPGASSTPGANASPAEPPRPASPRLALEPGTVTSLTEPAAGSHLPIT